MLLVRVPIDINGYVAVVGGSSGDNNKKELELENGFPCEPISIGNPTTIVDKSGKILAWILPSLLSTARQVSKRFDGSYLGVNSTRITVDTHSVCHRKTASHDGAQWADKTTRKLAKRSCIL